MVSVSSFTENNTENKMKNKMHTPVAKELLDILACPRCKNEVTLTQDGRGLVCEQCSVVYEIRDGIPVMLIDEAVPLSDWPAKL